MKKNSWWEKVKDFYLVWSWSKRYNRYVNTHKFYNQREAELTVSRPKHIVARYHGYIYT